MIFGFGEFEFDDERLKLRRAGRVVKTEAVAKRLLAALVRRAGELVTKEELIQEVWEGRAVADNVITVAMARLRKTLNAGRGGQEHVLTVYGRGYRFVGPLVTRDASELQPYLPLDNERAASPFVGRERVLERLEHALADARRGRGRLCVLMGEPGIGKTRAVEALEQRLANTQVRVAWGFCREVGDTPPLSPWLRLLREVMNASSSKSAEIALGPAVNDLSQLLESGGHASESALESFNDSVRLPGDARHESFDVFARAFARAAEDGPWVLVLDDLHRADAASIELLSFLIDEIAHSRILILATLRHAAGRRAPRPETHLPYVLGHRNCERIALDRLREEDVATYVAALTEDADGRIARAVFAKSEGNPFFMTELSRQLREAELADPDGLTVPDIALDLIRQRVAKLERPAREVLAAAAVIGRTFELALLQLVTGQVSSALMACLDEAIAADLVVAAPDSTTAFAFGHDLMRAVLYEALAPAEQRRWHIRTADALERRIAIGDAVPPSELAYHLHAALPESDLRKTVHYCRAASAAAATVYATSDVVRYLRHALEALNLTERPSVRLRIGLYYQIVVYGRGLPASQFVPVITELVRLAREHGNATMLVRAALVLNAYPGFAPIPGARAALEHALSILPPDDKLVRSIALSALACTAPYCFDAKLSDPLVAEARPLARSSGSRAALYVSLVSWLFGRAGPGNHDEAMAAAEELMELWRKNPGPRMAVAPLYVALFRALTALQRGDQTRTQTAIEQGIVHAREVRNTQIWQFERFQAIVQINAGEWAESLPKLVALHRRAEQHGILGTEPLCAFDRIVIFGELSGDLPVLDDGVRSALDIQSNDPPNLWAMKLRALAAAGLLDEARAVLRLVAPSELANIPSGLGYVGTLAHLVHAAVRLGETEHMRALVPLLEPYRDLYAGQLSFLCEGSVPQLLGMLACGLGNHAEAIPLLEQGVLMNERAGFVPRAAEATVLLATCLLEHGKPSDREQGLALARKAHRLATRVGMRAVTRVAANLLKT